MVKIDGEVFDVPVASLTRGAVWEDKYKKKTQDGRLQRELVGIYYQYTLTLGLMVNIPEYHRFWRKITEMTDFHTIEVPYTDGRGSITFEAWLDGVSDQLSLAQEAGSLNYFDGANITFTSRDPIRS